MLRYDAALWRVDSWVEIGVIGGVLIDGLFQLFELYSIAVIIDGLFAIALVAVSIKVPLQHGREAFRQLLDRTLPDRMQYEVLGVIAENTKNMCEFKRVHTRQSGRDIFIEIDLVMPYDHTLEDLYKLEQRLLSSLREKFPTAIPRVYVTPCDRRCDDPEGATCPLKRQLNAAS